MIDAVLGILGTILYPLFAIFFVLIDLLQAIFRTFAGVGDATYKINSLKYDEITAGTGEDLLADNNGGIVYYLLRSDIVMNLVWSIATLALVLIIVFTVIAFIKNIYAPKSKSWQEIIGLSMKGLFNFIFIPVVCLLGIILGNILLNAIDGATSTGGATIMSRKLFLSAAYDANRVRVRGSVSYDQANDIVNLYNKVFGAGSVSNTLKEGDVATDEATVNYYANLVDEAYAHPGKGFFGHVDTDIHQLVGVVDHYKVVSINYLTLAVGGVFIMYVLGSVSFGMIKRMFTLIMLFIISPAACAMYPLDEGNACKQVTGDFKKNTISAYGAVAGMNIFFSIAPIVENINITGSGFGAGLTSVIGLDAIVHLILLICGLFMVKDFISMISNYFGAGNAYEQGAGLMNAVKKKVGDTASKGAKMAGSFRKAAVAAGSTGQAKDFFKSLGSDAGLGALKGLTGLDITGIKKTWKDSKEEGQKYVDERGKRIKAEGNNDSEKDAFNKAVAGIVDPIMSSDAIKQEIEDTLNRNKKLNELSTEGTHFTEDRDEIEKQIRKRETKKASKEVTAERYGTVADFTKDADGNWNMEAALKHLAGLKGDKATDVMYKYVAKTNGDKSVEDFKSELDAYKATTRQSGEANDNTVNTVTAVEGQIEIATSSINELSSRISDELAADKYSAGSYTSAMLSDMMGRRQTVSQGAIDKLVEDGNIEGATKLSEFNKKVEELTAAEERRKSLMAEQESAIKSYIAELTSMGKKYSSMEPSLSEVIKSLGELAKGMSDGTKKMADFQAAMQQAKNDVKDIVKGKK